MIAAKEENLKFTLLSPPKEKTKRSGEVFGVGLFALHKDGEGDRFPVEIEVFEDDNPELFKDVLKRARSKAKTKKLEKGSVVRVTGSVKHSSWRKKDDSGWDGKYSFIPTELSFG